MSFTPEQQRIIAAANARADADCAAAFAAAETHAESPQAARSPGGEPLTRQAPSRRATIAPGVETPPPPPPAPGATIAAAAAPVAERKQAARPMAERAQHFAGQEPSLGGAATPEAPTLFDQPAARWSDPDTSHLAAASITEQKRRDAHRAVLTILADGPASDFDLAASTGLKQTSIGKRRGELRDAGLVCEHDRAGVSDTGSACIRWALTPAGREAARTEVAA